MPLCQYGDAAESAPCQARDTLRNRPGGLASGRFVRPSHRQVSLLFMGTPPTIQFASLGMADTLILMVLALVVFGPRRLPQIGRQIGKLMYEFRKASNDFKFQMEEELRNAEDADRRKQEEERLRVLAAAAPPQPAVDSQVADSTPAVITPIADAPAEDTYPRIQPPSTGEPVQAAKPGVPAQLTAALQTSENLDPGSESPLGTTSESLDPSSGPCQGTTSVVPQIQQNDPWALAPEVSPETTPAPEQARHG
jgi:sec-independent protein translocase protein TatB